MATLEEVLRDMGANDQMINSRTFKMAQQAIAEGAVDGVADAELVEQRVRESTETGVRLLRLLEGIYEDSNRLLDVMNAAHDRLETDASKVTVTNKKTLEAINAYEMVLARTKAVVGDEGMTEAVWVKAIEAGSYCAWRSIMGPKFPDGQGEGGPQGYYQKKPK